MQFELRADWIVPTPEANMQGISPVTNSAGAGRVINEVVRGWVRRSAQLGTGEEAAAAGIHTLYTATTLPKPDRTCCLFVARVTA